MKKLKNKLWEMKTFLLLWITQSFSGLGSAMTSYALVIWSYTQRGSALVTPLLMVSFLGGPNISENWKRRICKIVDSRSLCSGYFDAKKF